MINHKALVFLAAFYGRVHSASATVCDPTYVSGGSYSTGDSVSAATTTTVTTTEACAAGLTGCVGSIKVTALTTTAIHNYVCKVGTGALCSQVAYAPHGLLSASAWTKCSPCSVSVGCLLD